MKLSEQVLQFALERAHVLWMERKDKTDHMNRALSHKTGTTTVIKLSRVTLAKPVNTNLMRRQGSGSKFSGRVMTGVCMCVLSGFKVYSAT